MYHNIYIVLQGISIENQNEFYSPNVHKHTMNVLWFPIALRYYHGICSKNYNTMMCKNIYNSNSYSLHFSSWWIHRSVLHRLILATSVSDIATKAKHDAVWSSPFTDSFLADYTNHFYRYKTWYLKQQNTIRF